MKWTEKQWTEMHVLTFYAQVDHFKFAMTWNRWCEHCRHTGDMRIRAWCDEEDVRTSISAIVVEVVKQEVEVIVGQD